MNGNSQFASLDLDAAGDFAMSASSMIRGGSKESPLRHLLSTSLPKMFPENPWWIQIQATGAETNARYRDRSKDRSGFIDTLIGKTAVEYEKNLDNKEIYNEGYRQVREYCASLINDGVTPDDIIGVLSDTVRWYAYTVEAADGDHEGLWGPDDINLIECQYVDLETLEETSFQEFELFVNRYLGRLGARNLNAESLAKDFGNKSQACYKLLPSLTRFFESNEKLKTSEGSLAFSLWKQFHSVVGAGSDDLKIDDYAYDLYLVTLAKLICANLIDGQAHLRSDAELVEILNGSFFTKKGLLNVVEHDCFYWLVSQPDAQTLVNTSASLQHDLAVYDFASVEAEDLFGKLISQLSADKKRILLGQEPTPRWLASKMVAECELGVSEDETPKFLDMCCGSGVFVVETIKNMLNRFGHPVTLSEFQKSAILSSVTGFDIDPVSVIFAKVNWVLALKDHVLDFSDGARIPIYQADSLFSTSLMGGASSSAKSITFDGKNIEVPAILFDPEYVVLFDELITSCQELVHSACFDSHRASTRALSRCSITIEEADRPNIETFAESLLSSFRVYGDSEVLDIWSFVIRNCYKPRMLEGRFNGIASNPPWLSMSKLSRNPYTEALNQRAELFGIKPPGMAFLHLELATVFLLTACKRYAKPNCKILCIVPTTVLNGYHQEPFRREQYRSADSPVPFKVEGIWTLPDNTFKNKAIVLSGVRSELPAEYPLQGTAISQEDCEATSYSLVFQGNRSAWSTKSGKDAVVKSADSLPFSQGADLMPRTFVFFDAQKQQNGKYTLKSIPTRGHDLSYLVSDAKKAKGFVLDDVSNVPEECLHACIISKQVMPFIMSNPAVGFLPIKVDSGGYKLLTNLEIQDLGRNVQLIIDKEMSYTDSAMPPYESIDAFFEKVNVYNKLTKQGSWAGSWFVLYGAGGQDVAAAVIDLNTLDFKRIIFDQTVYWMQTDTFEEALFYAGLFNSDSLNNAIKEFQPEGEFGKRHIHLLPPAVVPKYDSDNPQHQAVVSYASVLLEEIKDAIGNDGEFRKLVNPAEGTLQARRRKYRIAIKRMDAYEDYAKACAMAMGL